MNIDYSLFVRKELQDSIDNGFSDDKPYVYDLEVLSVPNAFVIRNVLKPIVLQNLRSELALQTFNKKETDMYKIRQSTEFSNMDISRSPMCVKLQQIFNKNLKKLVERIFMRKFPGNVSMSASKYQYNDYLLCHDDQVEDRKVAYILYLNDNWTAADGGTLDFFGHDEKGLPQQISHSIVPESNKLVLFAVDSQSHHQVSEVISKKKVRLAISGWFHSGEKIKKVRQTLMDEPNQFSAVVLKTPVTNFVFQDDYKYLHHDLRYFAVNSQLMHKEFIKNHSLLLNDFLSEECYNNIMSELESEHINWTTVGSSGRRRYEIAKLKRRRVTRCPSLSKLLAEFQGSLFLKLLSHIVMKKLDVTDPENRAVISVDTEVVRLKHQSYSLVVDDRLYKGQASVDMWLFFNSNHIQFSTGGDVGYINAERVYDSVKKGVLRVEPTDNSAFIIARTPKLLPFISYMNHKVGNNVHYAIYMKYLMDFSESDLGAEPDPLQWVVCDKNTNKKTVLRELNADVSTRKRARVSS